MSIPNVTVQVSAVDQTWISIALSKPYIDRRIAIYKAFLDYRLAIISNPLLVFDGRIDSMEISDDPNNGTCTIAVTASSQWVDFQRTPGRHTIPSLRAVLNPILPPLPMSPPFRPRCGRRPSQRPRGNRWFSAANKSRACCRTVTPLPWWTG
jgi:hypothetical protein